MKKPASIFLILIIIMAGVIAGILIIKGFKQPAISKPIEISDKTLSQKDKELIMDQIKTDYEKDIAALISDYNNSLQKNLLNINCSDLKERLFAMKVPAEYKEFHLSLAIAFDRLNSAVNENDDDKINQAVNDINLIIEKNKLKQNK